METGFVRRSKQRSHLQRVQRRIMTGVTQMSRETRRKRRFEEVSYQCHMNRDEWRQKVNKDRKEKVNLITPI